MTSIVSFNIIRKVKRPDGTVVDKLLNKSNFPIMFVSEKPYTFTGELKDNKELWEVLNNNGSFTYINYSNTSIQGVKYKIDSGEFSEEVVNVQDLYDLTSFDEGKDIAIELIEYYLRRLYDNTGGKATEYKDNASENISLIYNFLQENFPDEFNDEMLINFIKDKLISVSNFNDANAEYAISLVKKMLKID